MPKKDSPRLLIAKDEATQKVNAAIEAGQELLGQATSVSSEEQLSAYQYKYAAWDERNVALIKTLVTGPELLEEYQAFQMIVTRTNAQIGERANYVKVKLEERLRRLSTLKEKIAGLEQTPKTEASKPEAESTNQASAPAAATPANSNDRHIFIAHGDDATKQAVAAFLNKLDFVALPANESPQATQNLMEQVESQPSLAAAIILMLDTQAAELLANRQALIFELGFFMGKLGSKRVLALKAPSILPPPGVNGLVYVNLDDSGTWQLTLAKEMKKVGLPVDMNKAI